MTIPKIKILKIVLFVVILITTILWFVQEDHRFQQFVQTKIINILQKEWKSKINVKSSDVNLFTGTIELQKSCVKSTAFKDCQWCFESADVKFSRLDLFFSKKITLKIIFNDVDAKSVYQKQHLCITDHLKDVLAPSKAFDVDLRSIVVNNLKLNVLYKTPNIKNNKNILLHLKGNFDFKKVINNNFKQDVWRGKINCKDGYLKDLDKNFLDKISCRMFFYFLDTDPATLYVNARQEFDFLGQHSFLNLKIDGNLKNIFANFTQKDLTIRINPSVDGLNIKSKIPFSCVKNISKLLGYDFTNTFDGLINLDLFLNSSNCLNGRAFLKNNIANLQGDVNFDLNNFKGKLKLFNTDILKHECLQSYYINKQQAEFDISLNKDFSLDVNYNVLVDNYYSDDNQILKGKCFFKDKKLKLAGYLDKSKYFLDVDLNLSHYIKKLSYFDENQEVINFYAKDKDLFASVSYDFVRKYFATLLQQNLLGRNASIAIRLKDILLNQISGSCKLGSGKLLLVGNYNPIENFDFNFNLDFDQKRLEIDNFKLKCLRGCISSPYSNVALNEDYEIKKIYCPIKIDNLLVNVKHDFYALVDGDLLLNKKCFLNDIQSSVLKLKGNVVLKKSLIKANNLSSNRDSSFIEKNYLPQSDLFLDNVVELDIDVSNQSLTKVKSDFFNVDVAIDLNFHGYYFDNKVYMPDIEGEVLLEHGGVSFLKNKLFITDGKIQFISGQFDNPMIDIIAKNKIKKYLVNMQVTGSLVQPRVLFEASPELREDQILALLMSGSENASLQKELPVMFLQNLNDFIAKDEKLFGKTKTIFQKLTLPFKYIQITPEFKNQFTQSGVKGTLSIDFNKQMHLLIQKSFNLHDDLAFQLEYFLTDNVNFKMLKDQSGEVGAEVEVRFKL